MKKHATVDPLMSITVGPAAEVRDLSDDPTALAEAQEREAGPQPPRNASRRRRRDLSGAPAGLRPSPEPLPPQTRTPRR